MKRVKEAEWKKCTIQWICGRFAEHGCKSLAAQIIGVGAIIQFVVCKISDQVKASSTALHFGFGADLSHVNEIEIT